MDGGIEHSINPKGRLQNIILQRHGPVSRSHLGSLRRAGCVDSAGFHTVGFVSAAQREATFPPPLVAVGQRAVTPGYTRREMS